MTVSTQRSGVKRLRHGCKCTSVFTGSTRLQFNYSASYYYFDLCSFYGAESISGVFSGSQEAGSKRRRYKKFQGGAAIVKYLI